MTRLALAIVVTAATGVGIVTHHHKHSAASSAASAEVIPLRASRSQEKRQPLPGVNAAVPSVKARHHLVPKRVARPAPGSGLSDVTMYCATGNRNAAGRWPQLGDVAVLDRSIRFGTRLLIAGRRYIVEDWIGSGSQFDIFGGDDTGCEQRALTFGRQHLRVEVAQ